MNSTLWDGAGAGRTGDENGANPKSVHPGPLQDFYQAALAKGIKPTMARLTLARKIAAITLTLWKKGESFDAKKLKSQAA